MLPLLVSSVLLAQSNAVEWFNSGLAHHSGARYDDALKAYAEAARLGYQPAFAPLYRSARALSMKNERAAALDFLQRAADGGFAALPLLLNDADFNHARAGAAFGKIAKQIDLNGKPCLTSARYREFDFWIGEWSVTATANGGPAGENDVIPILDGCGVMENWQPTNGNRGRGKSFNFFDPATQRWRQLYLSDNGLVAEFAGQLKDGAMHFTREFTRQGQAVRERMVFTPLPSGQVRQWWEQSGDEGKTWSTLFDGTYTRKRAAR